MLTSKERAELRSQATTLDTTLMVGKSGITDALIAETQHLKEYQETPSPEEDLAKIPMLERSDLRKEVLPYSNIEEKIGIVPVIRHDYDTNGIDYFSLLFDL